MLEREGSKIAALGSFIWPRPSEAEVRSRRGAGRLISAFSGTRATRCVLCGAGTRDPPGGRAFVHIVAIAATEPCSMDKAPAWEGVYVGGLSNSEVPLMAKAGSRTEPTLCSIDRTCGPEGLRKTAAPAQGEGEHESGATLWRRRRRRPRTPGPPSGQVRPHIVRSSHEAGHMAVRGPARAEGAAELVPQLGGGCQRRGSGGQAPEGRAP